MSGTTARRVAGVASMAIDGVYFDVVGDLAYSPATIKRESLIGQSGPQGYSEMPQLGFISVNIRDAGSLTVQDFNQMTNVTIQCELANGKSIVASNAWCVESSEMKTMESVMSLRFDSTDLTEITTA